MKTTINLAAFIFLISLSSCKKNVTSNSEKLTVITSENIDATLPVQKEIYKKVNGNIGGYLEALPVGYADSINKLKRYPLLITIHGILELGNGTTQLYLVTKNAVPKLLKAQSFPASFTVDSTAYSFIVLSPQFKKRPNTKQVNDMFTYAIKKYRVDSSRMYLTGLSMGGAVAFDYASAYGKRIAAVVPVCGDTLPTDARASDVAQNNVAVWAFHNQYDTTAPVTYTKTWITKINSYSPVIPAIQTIFQSGGHDAWTKASSPTYRENGKNIYEWMLQYHR